jgi:hypothetical protein
VVKALHYIEDVGDGGLGVPALAHMLECYNSCCDHTTPEITALLADA